MEIAALSAASEDISAVPSVAGIGGTADRVWHKPPLVVPNNGSDPLLRFLWFTEKWNVFFSSLHSRAHPLWCLPSNGLNELGDSVKFGMSGVQ